MRYAIMRIRFVTCNAGPARLTMLVPMPRLPASIQPWPLYCFPILLAVPLLPALLDQFCDQTRPAGLVAGTEAGTIVPVEVFEVG